MEVKFCSTCKWAKEVETFKGIEIFCQRHKNPTTPKGEEWTKTCTVFRKLNSPACAYHEDA